MPCAALAAGPARGWAFPADVAGPVQFGPRLEVLAAYLRHAQHLPTARSRTLLRELKGVALSMATIKALCRCAAALLAPEAARQQAQALAVLVVCMNEIGLRVTGSHSGCTGSATRLSPVTAWGPRRRLAGVRVHGRTRLLRLLLDTPAGQDRPRPLQCPPASPPAGNCRVGEGTRRLGCAHAAAAAQGPGRCLPLVRGDRRSGAGIRPRGDVRRLGRVSGVDPGPLREPAAGSRAVARPQPGLVDAAGCLPPVHGRSGRTLHQQSGGLALRRAKPREDRGRLSHAGRGRALRPHTGPGRDRPPAGVVSVSPRPPCGEAPTLHCRSCSPSRPNPTPPKP